MPLHRYYLTLTSFQPLYGKLSDIFGRKACLLFAYTIFGVGCLGCGLAQDMAQLCISRAISGIGGGGMNAVVSILLTDLVPLRERGLWQGYMNVVACTGTSIGGPLGGFLADSIGWRWSFIAQFPLCVLAFIAVYFVLDIPPPADSKWMAKIRKIDFLGAFVLILAVVAVLVGLDCGSNLGWSHTITIVSLALTPVFFILFMFVEMKVATFPFAPGRIIFDRNLFACYASNFCGQGGFMAMVYTAPLYFQAVLGVSATVSGAFLVPPMLAVVTASVGGGWFVKKTGRFYWISVLSLGLALLSVVPAALSVMFNSTVGELIGLFLVAFGSNSVVTTSLVGLIANAEPDDMAIAVACSYLFRSLGSSIAVSLSSAALQQVLRTQLAARFTDGEEARLIEEKVRQSLDYIRKLSPRQAEIVIESYRWATLGGYTPTMVLFLVGFIVAFWIKEKPLRK